MIEVRQVGRSGLRVSALCMGTANFGDVTDTTTAHRILSRGLDAGITCIDTADIYNRSQGLDASEIIVGRWLDEDRSRRQQIVLSTKVFGTTGDGPNDAGLSARHMRLACDESLRRLRTDWIDLYVLHHVDMSVRWDETLDALDRLAAAGKILYVGTSNFAAWHLTAMHLTASARGMFGPVSEQSTYSLARREVELEVLPACHAQGIGFFAYSPLAAGLLAGPQRGRRREEGETARLRQLEAERLSAWHDRCRDHGLAPADAALAWVLAQPAVTAAVIGPRNEAQLDAAVAAATRQYDDSVLQALAEPWPGPGTAPEAYAW
jgi:NDP-hexose 2,3-enoyl reductase